MSAALLALLLAHFTAIGALPLAVFRRDGRLTPGWHATALPFFLAALALLAGAFELPFMRPVAIVAPNRDVLESLAALASAGSLALMVWTAASHRTRPALWRQAPERDAPAEIVTWGPYARIRHPFYASFLLAFAAAFAALPHAATASLLAYSALALALTAAREERRLAASAFGDSYRDYMGRTGRFLPRLLPQR